MIKKLLQLNLLLLFGIVNSQNLISENFDNITTLSTNGWVQTNQSTPVGTNPNWFQGSDVPGGGPFNSYNGTTNSYIGCNYNSVAGSAIISNWLITPALSLENGDVISFYTRTVDIPAYADRLELRLNTTAGPNPSGGNSDLGGFTTLLLSVNPTLTASGYPNTWTQFSAVISGLSGTTACKIALRYYVTSGGPSGSNSDYIGVDAFSVDRPLSAESFNVLNVKMYPNPATNNVTISSSDAKILKTEIIDLNGRIIISEAHNDLSSVTINIESLQTGIYSLNVATENGNGTTKLIKK